MRSISSLIFLTLECRLELDLDQTSQVGELPANRGRDQHCGSGCVTEVTEHAGRGQKSSKIDLHQDVPRKKAVGFCRKGLLSMSCQSNFLASEART
jgi:hypothetical protein